MVKTGLDVLLAELTSELGGVRVGVLANHASVTHNLIHISDALKCAGINLTAMFGPEHGVRGNHADGVSVSDWIDERLGIPVHSLYGSNISPTDESLHDIDILLIDLQDVGARFYTFVYTMANSILACSKKKIPVWVLDRPNPITGDYVEGPARDPDFKSSVGFTDVPIRHGLTIGELALLCAKQIECDNALRIIKMKNWKRDMWHDDTGLPWVMPSPNMSTIVTAVVYPGFCLIEGTNVSEGRGTTRPFELLGAPWINPFLLKEELNSLDLPGVEFREAFFTPASSKYKGEQCAGVQVHITERSIFKPVLTGISVIFCLHKLCREFEFKAPSSDGNYFFDLLAGSSRIREAIESGQSPFDIERFWQDGLNKYKKSIGSTKLY